MEDNVNVLVNSDSINFAVNWITAREMSSEMKRGTKLTGLQTKKVIELIKEAIKYEGTPEKIIIDNFDQSSEGLLSRMKRLDNEINSIKTNWIIENYADEKYGEVMVAGMIAKHVYDLHLKQLDKKFGTGSGQPNDLRVLKFLYEHSEHYNIECEGCRYIRASWITFKRLHNPFQRELLRERLQSAGLL